MVHTSFTEESYFQPSSVLTFTTICVFTVLCCWQKYFASFQRQRVPKMFSLRHKRIA
ncbi:hypothetical protein I79_006350 [Cricetulus griseus]|uniref:Uncharacterized protein n=1 Tax=Cricetulus griseus TaxID=10029 RepID=G3H7L6_CRIGR|nr:hypothetical protein I79_006350 [Cricetulus griseus]